MSRFSVTLTMAKLNFSNYELIFAKFLESFKKSSEVQDPEPYQGQGQSLRHKAKKEANFPSNCLSRFIWNDFSALWEKFKRKSRKKYFAVQISTKFINQWRTRHFMVSPRRTDALKISGWGIGIRERLKMVKRQKNCKKNSTTKRKTFLPFYNQLPGSQPCTTGPL